MKIVMKLYENDHNLDDNMFTMAAHFLIEMGCFFMILQTLGIIFTIFGMYKAMMAYTCLMWSSAIIVLAGSSLATHHRNFIFQLKV